MNGSRNGHESAQGINKLSVSGYKSLYDETSIEIRPLTILAGANSSGKSSIMEPLLLLKQTLETAFDQGPLYLSGPNVVFGNVDEFLSRQPRGRATARMEIGIDLDDGRSIRNSYTPAQTGGLDLVRTRFDGGPVVDLCRGMSDPQIRAALPDQLRRDVGAGSWRFWSWAVERQKTFLAARHIPPNGSGFSDLFSWAGPFEQALLTASHVLAPRVITDARGAPARTYPMAPQASTHPGRFSDYTGAVIYWWQETDDPRLSHLTSALRSLGLTSQVAARRISDAEVEVLIGRLPRGGRGKTPDLVNLVDAGSGVSQVLPVLVAQIAAEPGQLVYLAEPEMDLHPRAQSALAEIVAGAAKRGIRVVAETHSSLLLLGIETLVAEGKLDRGLVKLHWFSRDKKGVTKVASADLDDAGAFGDWPEDFARTELEADSRYLNAAEQALGLR